MTGHVCIEAELTPGLRGLTPRSWHVSRGTVRRASNFQKVSLKTWVRRTLGALRTMPINV